LTALAWLLLPFLPASHLVLEVTVPPRNRKTAEPQNRRTVEP
jgi:hypothetical protein